MRYILSELEEKEREETFRLKRVKQKKDKEKNRLLQEQLDSARGVQNKKKEASNTSQRNTRASDNSKPPPPPKQPSPSGQPPPPPEAPVLAETDTKDFITLKKPDDVTETDIFIAPSVAKAVDSIKEVEELIGEEDLDEIISWHEIPLKDKPTASQLGKVESSRPSVSKVKNKSLPEAASTSSGPVPRKTSSDMHLEERIEKSQMSYSDKTISTSTKFSDQKDEMEDKKIINTKYLLDDSDDSIDFSINSNGKVVEKRRKTKRKSLDDNDSDDFSINSVGKVVESRSYIKIHQSERGSLNEKKSHFGIRSLLHLQPKKESKHETHEKENKTKSKDKIRILDSNKNEEKEISSKSLNDHKTLKISESKETRKDKHDRETEGEEEKKK